MSQHQPFQSPYPGGTRTTTMPIPIAKPNNRPTQPSNDSSEDELIPWISRRRGRGRTTTAQSRMREEEGIGSGSREAEEDAGIVRGRRSGSWEEAERIENSWPHEEEMWQMDMGDEPVEERRMDSSSNRLQVGGSSYGHPSQDGSVLAYSRSTQRRDYSRFGMEGEYGYVVDQEQEEGWREKQAEPRSVYYDASSMPFSYSHRSESASLEKRRGNYRRVDMSSLDFERRERDWLQSVEEDDMHGRYMERERTERRRRHRQTMSHVPRLEYDTVGMSGSSQRSGSFYVPSSLSDRYAGYEDGQGQYGPMYRDKLQEEPPLEFANLNLNSPTRDTILDNQLSTDTPATLSLRQNLANLHSAPPPISNSMDSPAISRRRTSIGPPGNFLNNFPKFLRPSPSVSNLAFDPNNVNSGLLDRAYIDTIIFSFGSPRAPLRTFYKQCQATRTRVRLQTGLVVTSPAYSTLAVIFSNDKSWEKSFRDEDDNMNFYGLMVQAYYDAFQC